MLKSLVEAEKLIQQSSLYTNSTVRAEASRYLLKTLSYHLERDILAADPKSPRLVYYPGFGGPNVGTLYISYNQIQQHGRYRLYGRLGSVNQTIIGLYSSDAYKGAIGAGPRINGYELKLEDDGSFELFVGGEKRGKNWVSMPDNVISIVTYQIRVI